MKSAALAVILLAPRLLQSQVDQAQAAAYFKEAAAVCEREGGKLWGISLCGPMVIADAASRTLATNQAAPEASRPAVLGFANAALDWGGTRWSTFAWQFIPADKRLRQRLWMHELFHRVQPQLGFTIRDGANDHLDTLDGRYWLQLEWRGLARALASSGDARRSAIRDALAFRLKRRTLFSGADESERLLEMNEGLAQYTATVTAFESRAESIADAIQQLKESEQLSTFVRTFAYPTGAGYGILLDEASPGWLRKLKYEDDFGRLIAAAAGLQAAPDAETAAARYDGAALRTSEERRDDEQKSRVAELRRRFVEGPVLSLPRPNTGAFTTAGMTPLPGDGTIYPRYRATAEWGTIEAAMVLVSADRTRIVVPSPANTESLTIRGEGWTVTLAPGWVARPAPRKGDFEIVRR
jgi:hypothetical protein